MGQSTMNRRHFLTATTAGLATTPLSAAVAPSDPETLVAQLYDSLSEAQKQSVVFPFDHPLRHRVANNWHVTEERVGQFFNADQRTLIAEIFNGLHSPEFLPELHRKLRDDEGGIDRHSIALFGQPGQGAFEFVLTGRHMTARCDGDSVAGAAFGGPIFYGHEGEKFYEEPTHPGNIYWFQAKRANEVFQALDGKQRELALHQRGRRERETQTVALQATAEGIDGLPVSEMSADQRQLVGEVLSDLLKPFREADRKESMKLIDANGGIEALKMTFYRQGDLGGDGIWDVWQLESPTMVWHFRGSPHVHVYVNIRDEAGWQPDGGTQTRGRRGRGRRGARRRG